jgi:hypothetical protein
MRSSRRTTTGAHRRLPLVASLLAPAVALLVSAPASAHALIGPAIVSGQPAHLALVKPGARERVKHAHRGSAPLVTGQPQTTLVAPGDYAVFTAAASGSPRPAAHWQISVDGGLKWRDIAGARERRLSFMALAGQNGNEFRAVFANKHGRSVSAAATLQVTAADSAPLILTQPSDQSVADCTTASFTASASGQPAPTVQWEISENGGASWSDVADANAPTLSFTASASLNGAQFRAAFSNAVGSALSSVTTLTTTASSCGAPTITEQPQTESVEAGQTAAFTAAASGNPAPSVQWQVSTNDGASWQAISGATSDSYSFTASAQQNLSEYEAVFTSSTGSVTSDPAVLGVGYDLAENWSGYAATGSGFSAVTASWRVPAVTCPSGAASSFSSQWVGLDGVDDASVEQDGTDADCIGTTASYAAWYELYGDGAVNGGAEVPLSSGCTGVADCTVNQGDVITASVSVDGTGNWTFALSDATAPDVWSFSTTIAWTAPSRTSAEWIVERPEYCDDQGNCEITPLANFGTVQFTNATATTTGSPQTIAALGGQPIEMISSATDSTLLGSPSPLDSSGDFTDTWSASS